MRAAHALPLTPTVLFGLIAVVERLIPAELPVVPLQATRAPDVEAPATIVLFTKIIYPGNVIERDKIPSNVFLRQNAEAPGICLG